MIRALAETGRGWGKSGDGRDEARVGEKRGEDVTKQYSDRGIQQRERRFFHI